MNCTVTLLKKAFKKLLSYAYYDKTDMVLRRSVAGFVNRISVSTDREERIFEKISTLANGKDDVELRKHLRQMHLSYYPKKLKEKYDCDKKLVTNEPREENCVERFLIKTYIPIELLIIDVAWIMQYAYVLDNQLSIHCCGNRLNLYNDDENFEENGDSLFCKYSNKYQKWWMDGVNAANIELDKKIDISIINLDISNYYHSVKLDFASVVNTIAEVKGNESVRVDPMTHIISEILNRYWELLQLSNLKMFQNAKISKPLPLSLMSSAVIANWYLKPLDDYLTEKADNIIYYGRYVDDMMIVVKKKSNDQNAIKRAIDELNPLLKGKEGKYYLDIKENKINELIIQEEKVYVYSFNSKIPQLGIEKYVSEQTARSSEFRFMTAEVAPAPLELENITLVGAMDANYEGGKKFDILEESKFRLSVYLAKLATRLAKNKDDKKCLKEVDKVASYFKDVLTIKHYQLWEKMLTLFVLAGRGDYVNLFKQNVLKLIDQLTCSNESLFYDKYDAGMEILKESLRMHFNESMTLALSLAPHGNTIDKIYYRSLMIRMHFNYFPLQEFSKNYSKEGVRLPLKRITCDFSKACKKYRWVPYYVKFADVLCALSLGSIFNGTLYKKAWEIYCSLNSYKFDENDLEFVNFVNVNGTDVIEFNPDITFGDDSAFSCRLDSPLNLSLVGMKMEQKSSSMIKSFGKTDTDYDKKLRIALDKVSEQENTDIFILPECALSISELKEFCLYSSRRQVAFICGLEYYIKQNYVYNYVVTCLPIKLHGKHDALPVIRLKNYYAPSEIEDIKKKKKNVPAEYDTQALYHWHGHVFTTYNCYELCNPKHRSFFFNCIDAMYCPVYNPDTYYFNNIAESTARDMHCFFILSNPSQYGDSRVSIPAAHMFMNLLKVKGGNTSDNEVTILSCNLDYIKLRSFQLGKIVDTNNNEKIKFKPLPPGFKEFGVQKRKEKFSFRGDDQLPQENLGKRD